MCKKLLVIALYLVLLFTFSCSLLLGEERPYHTYASKRGKYVMTLPTRFEKVPVEEQGKYASFFPLFSEGKFPSSPDVSMWKLGDEYTLANIVVVSQDCNTTTLPKTWYVQGYAEQLKSVPYLTKVVSSTDEIFGTKHAHVFINTLEVQQKHNLWQKHYILFTKGRMYTIILTTDRSVFKDMEGVADVIVSTLSVRR